MRGKLTCAVNSFGRGAAKIPLGQFLLALVALPSSAQNAVAAEPRTKLFGMVWIFAFLVAEPDRRKQ